MYYKWIQSSLENRKDGASMCETFPGDSLFPRIGFSQRLLTSCAWFHLKLLTWTLLELGLWCHVGIYPHHICVLNLHSCWFSPCCYFLRTRATKPRLWISEWMLLMLKLVVSCHRSKDSVNSDRSAVWSFLFLVRLNILIPFAIANIWSLHAQNLQILWTVYFQQITTGLFIFQSEENQVESVVCWGIVFPVCPHI